MKKNILYIVLAFMLQAKAQNSTNPYGLSIISTKKELINTIKSDGNKTLVDLKQYIPSLTLDIKYATTNNIFYKKLYSKPFAFMRLPAAKALKKVQADLLQLGISLKIYDAYRPYSVTCTMFNILPDTIYMGLPWKGSKHNRGIAVDLTIIDNKTKKELQMPTPFDALVYASNPQFKDLPNEKIKNRDLLIAYMKKHGFTVDPVEWWHFNYKSDTEFEILDISQNTLFNFLNK